MLLKKTRVNNHKKSEAKPREKIRKEHKLLHELELAKQADDHRLYTGEN